MLFFQMDAINRHLGTLQVWLYLKGGPKAPRPFRQSTAHLSKKTHESSRRWAKAPTGKCSIAYEGTGQRQAARYRFSERTRVKRAFPSCPPSTSPGALRNSTQREPVCESRNDIAATLARPTRTHSDPDEICTGRSFDYDISF